MLPACFTFIDVETTGANPARDRITEIAVLRIEHGKIIQRWQTLINPEQAIPLNIQALTGISDAMVANAPYFSTISETLLKLLTGCIFVAHNARFDYGFIKKEFKQVGIKFHASVLCTVKLSQTLYPEHHRHSLDVLIERHALHCPNRHRAMSDAEAIHQFFSLVQEQFTTDTLTHAIQQAMQTVKQPSTLPEGTLAGLPDTPGVYQFFSYPKASIAPDHQNEKPLYAGSAASLRGHIMNLYSSRTLSRSFSEIIQTAQRLEWTETAGELEAQLHVVQLHKKMPSLHVSSGKKMQQEAAFALHLVPNRRRPPIFELIPVSGTDPRTWQGGYGPFSTQSELNSLLRELARLHHFCSYRLGFETASDSKPHSCMLCTGKETPAIHDARLQSALQAVSAIWPWHAPILFTESNQNGFCTSHLFDHWCYLGSASNPKKVLEKYSGTQRIFDIAIYRILSRWFANPTHRQAVTLCTAHLST